MSKYYYHGVDSVKTAIDILRSGGIKSKRLLGQTEITGFSRLDYISLCNKESDEFYRSVDWDNAYEWYIQFEIFFIISDDIPAFFPEFLDDGTIIAPHIVPFLETHPGQYTNLCDEWQVKDFIPLSKIIGIGIPFPDIYEYHPDAEEYEGIETLLELAKSLNLDIIDSFSEDCVDHYEEQKLKEKKKIKEKPDSQ